MDVEDGIARQRGGLRMKGDMQRIGVTGNARDRLRWK